MDQVLSMSHKERNKLLKTLKTRIHPDKHPNYSCVTQLFRNVLIFYEDCILSLESLASKDEGLKDDGIPPPKRKRKVSHSVQVVASKTFPQSFSYYDKWPHVQSTIVTMQGDVDDDAMSREMCHPIPPTRMLTKEMVPVYQAYKCIHARGAIAHGKLISLYKRNVDIIIASEKRKSVHDVFDEYGGTRKLESIEAIKEELVQYGPVISTSFRLLDIYLDQLRVGSKAFAKDLIGSCHELMIVGWCLTPYGEAWLVQPLFDEVSTLQIIRIGFGQFAVDDLVLAPESTMDHISWQPGPYFDYDFSDVENWREWNEMDLPILEKDLKKLSLCLPGGFMSGQSFVIRDEVKKAHSDSYKIKNIRWEENTMEWFVQVYQNHEDQSTLYI